MYAAPVWEAFGESEEDSSLQFVEYSIDERTPRLCREHFGEIAKDAAAARSDTITSAQAVAED